MTSDTIFAWFTYITVLMALVYLPTESALFLPYRFMMRERGVLPTVLAYCRACTGFWVGFFLGGIELAPFGTLGPLPTIALSSFFGMMFGYLWTKLWVNAVWHDEEAAWRAMTGEEPLHEAPDE